MPQEGKSLAVFCERAVERKVGLICKIANENKMKMNCLDFALSCATIAKLRPL